MRKQVGRFDTGMSIYDASGETKLEAYRDFVIAPDGIVPDQDGRTGHVQFLNGVRLEKGQVWGDSADEDMRRVQIRETVRSHLGFCGQRERCPIPARDGSASVDAAGWSVSAIILLSAVMAPRERLSS